MHVPGSVHKSPAKAPGKAPRPVPRPDRRFYAESNAFGRFGMRWFRPQLMPKEHYHGHIELNWLTAGSMDYVVDGHPLTVPSDRLVMFWAGIPHQTLRVDYGPADDSRQCNVYLPLDTFLHMPNLGKLTDTMMGGGVIALQRGAISTETLQRWYEDYRSGNAERGDQYHSAKRVTYPHSSSFLPRHPDGSRHRSAPGRRPARISRSLRSGSRSRERPTFRGAPEVPCRPA